MENSRLKPFGVLIGEWRTEATHRLLPGQTLHGNVLFEWLEDGVYLFMRSRMLEEGVPSSVAVFGTDDQSDAASMLYFDERGVSRRYETKLEEGVWSVWRNDPGFAQRFKGSFSEDGDTIDGVWELARNGTDFERDLALRYMRVR